MTVFISYTSCDQDLALTVRSSLEQLGVGCFIENFDRMDPRTLTDRLLELIDRCTHLIVVMTESTRNSWWVPFEIGAAVHGLRGVAVYAPPDATLPAFLAGWPRLSAEFQLKIFAELYAAYRLERASPQAAAAIRKDREELRENQRNLHLIGQQGLMEGFTAEMKALSDQIAGFQSALFSRIDEIR